MIKHDHHCGPGDPFPRFIKRWLGKYRNFNESCGLHDNLNEKNKTTRAEQDNQALNDMLKKCEKWYDIIVAYIYYAAMRSPFGWFSYHLAKIKKYYKGGQHG